MANIEEYSNAMILVTVESSTVMIEDYIDGLGDFDEGLYNYDKMDYDSCEGEGISINMTN